MERDGEEDIDNGIGMEVLEEGNCLQIIQRVGTLLPLNWCPHRKHWEVLDVVVAVVVDTENVVGDKGDDSGDISGKFDKLFTVKTI